MKTFAGTLDNPAIADILYQSCGDCVVIHGTIMVDGKKIHGLGGGDANLQDAKAAARDCLRVIWEDRAHEKYGNDRLAGRSGVLLRERRTSKKPRWFAR